MVIKYGVCLYSLVYGEEGILVSFILPVFVFTSFSLDFLLQALFILLWEEMVRG